MAKRILIFIFFLAFSGMTNAQVKLFDAPTGSGDRLFVPTKFGEKKWAFVFGFNPRWSFYQKQLVKMEGIRVGAELNGVHRFGVGVHGLTERIKFTGVTVNSPSAPDNPMVSFNARYLTLFYERAIFKTPRWDISIPTELAYGRLKAFYQTTEGNSIQYMEDPFAAVITGVQIRFYVFSWLIPRIGAGYRQSILYDKEVQLVFNRPYVTFGLQVVAGNLYRKVFPKKK